MSMFEKSFGQTLKDLADKLFGKKSGSWTGLLPGQRGYIQSVFDFPFDEDKCRLPSRPIIAISCNRYGQDQRAAKLSRKGPRNKKRLRLEGVYAR